MNKEDKARIEKSNKLTDKLYFMLMGESLIVGEHEVYTRVPGGWINAFFSQGSLSSVFIPYSEAECPEHIKQMADMFGDSSVKVPELEADSIDSGTAKDL